jgi:hypothetical protein
MISLNWKQVSAWRLARHHLLERAERGRLLDVVTQIGGLHAQVMSAAELALWARVQDVTPADVREALWRERSLVKTWAMRGTLHLFAADALPTYAAALSHSLAEFYRKPYWSKYFGLTVAELEAVTEGVRATLDGEGMTREQLAEVLAKRTRNPRLGELLGLSWGMLLKPAAHCGYLCFGPNQGLKVTFVQPEKWLGSWRKVDPAQAQQEIVRRYLTAYGPATVNDFARWWGVSAALSKQLLRSLGDEITEVDVEGRRAWALASTIKQMAALKPARAVRLLPLFDPYTVAVSPHSEHLSPAVARKRIYRPQGWISPVVLVDGRMEGIWSHEQKRGRVVVTVEMFAPPTAAVKRGIKDEAERLGAFLGAGIELNYA